MGKFRFKQFDISHERSSQKVGMDGVLLGAWAPVGGASRILDAGCGCGLIALMLAQRNPAALVSAIDTDLPSVEEAAGNFRLSPWPSRLEARSCAWAEETGTYDHIVSNPPFFDAGVSAPGTRREIARHATSSLSPQSLVDLAPKLLSPGGKLSLVMPYTDFPALKIDPAIWTCAEQVKVHGSPGAPPKRVLLSLTLRTTEPEEKGLRVAESDFVIYDENRAWTPQYKELTRDFHPQLPDS